MSATRNGKKYALKCEWDGKYFKTDSHKAKFCSDKCRLSAHRAKKTGNGRTINDLSPQALDRLQQILTISKSAYNTIFSILERNGANTASDAIRACFFLAEEMVEEMERNNER